MSKGKQGEIIVRISADGGRATLHAPTGLDATMVDAETLGIIVRQAGVVMTKQVFAAIARFADDYGIGEREHTAVIATATPPVHGTPARFEWAEGIAPTICDAPKHAAHTGSYPDERDPAAEGDEIETAPPCDHYAGRNYTHVTTGQIIGHIRRSTNVQDGTDVRGQPIKAKRGGPPPIRFHPSLDVLADDSVVARTDGVLVQTGDRVSITRTLAVGGDVDFSTGHIDFSGSVDIAGGICPGFRVRVEDDLRIGGLIEGATLACGRDLVARRGMVGQDAGSINVGRDARFAYLNDVNGIVGRTLHIDREVIDCELTIGGDMLSPNGTLFGGETNVTGSLVLKVLGSKGWAPTRVILGDVPVLRRQRKELRRRLTEIATQLEQLHESAYLLSLQPKTTENSLELEAIEAEQASLVAEQETITTRVGELAHEIADTRCVDLQVSEMIYPKVVLEVGDDIVRFEKEIAGPVAITRAADGALRYVRGSERGPLSSIADIARRGGSRRDEPDAPHGGETRAAA